MAEEYLQETTQHDEDENMLETTQHDEYYWLTYIGEPQIEL